MLAGPHLAVGALIGRAARRPWIALPLAFGSHCLLDALPHAHFTLRDGEALPLKGVILGTDGLVGLALVLRTASRQAHWRAILGSALAATALDLMNPLSSLGEWLVRSPGTAWLISLHLDSAHHVPFGDWLLGFGPSVAVLLLAAAASLSGAGRRVAA